LSRFDLIFLLLDKQDDDDDLLLARHVAMVHMNEEAPASSAVDEFDNKFLRAYVSKALTFEPKIPK
jgi:DNA replication licensing factor MCM7